MGGRVHVCRAPREQRQAQNALQHAALARRLLPHHRNLWKGQVDFLREPAFPKRLRDAAFIGPSVF